MLEPEIRKRLEDDSKDGGVIHFGMWTLYHILGHLCHHDDSEYILQTYGSSVKSFVRAQCALEK
jgi:hypothetical protein